MQEKIKKVASLSTSENWKKLKDATNTRYIQKVSEDKELMSKLQKNVKKTSSEEAVVDQLTGKLTKEEEKGLIERLVDKKQEAFDESSKRGRRNNAKLDVIPKEELIKRAKGLDADGLQIPGTNEVLIAEELPISRKLEVMDHEVGHKYQTDLHKDREFAENADLIQDYDAFNYDDKNYDGTNPDYYKESILERDTRKNEKVTRKGLDKMY